MHYPPTNAKLSNMMDDDYRRTGMQFIDSRSARAKAMDVACGLFLAAVVVALVVVVIVLFKGGR